MSSEYGTEPGTANRNNSHALILDLVGDDKRVLDVGTSTGYVAKLLSESGCEVVGLELDPAAARQAGEHCERIIVGDVESLDLEAELGGDSFDAVLFGDVLEHLRDPLGTVERLRPFVRPEGYIVASIPNVAHGSVRLALLQGRFDYTELGLLDDSHLRFFTRSSIERLFTEADLEIGVLERTTRGIFDTEVVVDRESVPDEVLELLRRDPEARTYQFVLTAHPAGEPGAATKARERLGRERHSTGPLGPSRTPEERLANLLRQLEGRNRQLLVRDGTIKELQRRVRNQGELQRRLGERERRLEERQREVSRLAQAVANRNLQLARNEKTIKHLNKELTRLQEGDG